MHALGTVLDGTDGFLLSQCLKAEGLWGSGCVVSLKPRLEPQGTR